MRNFKKRTIVLCLASAITVLGSFAMSNYHNSLVSLRIDRGSDGNVSFTAFTKKQYEQILRPERVDDSTYEFILQDTNSEVQTVPSLTSYSNIESIQISTYPCTPGNAGYTKITVKTSGNPVVSASTSLYIPDRNDDIKPISTISTKEPKAETNNTQSTPSEKKQSSYWEQHNQTSRPVETQQKDVKKTESSQKPKTSFKQKNTQSQEFNVDMPDVTSQGAGKDKLLGVIGLIVLAFLVLGIIFLSRDKMASIVGEQKDFDLGDSDEDTPKSKAKKIRRAINKLDNTYSNKQSSSGVNIVTGEVIKQPESNVEKAFANEEEESAVIVDLDSLYKEKTQTTQTENSDSEQDNEDKEDDLADLLSEFLFEEEQPEPPQETFDEELYEKTINNQNLNFSDNDNQRINQLLQNEIGEETLNNIEEFVPKESLKKPMPTQEEILENVLAEYAIKQNISFTKDDVDSIKKLISVELDETFITDLRTNPERTEVLQKELEEKEKKPHKSSEMLILNVKDLLPDLSKELAKQGNKKIVSDAKPEVVYYSDGYDVRKLSVSSDLANISKAAHDIKSNVFRPSDDLPIVENGYDVKTLSIKDLLPDIKEYKKNPNKFEAQKTKEKVDEKALLNSIANVQFKPFYDGVQEEMNQFEGFEIIDSEAQEEKEKQDAFIELERQNQTIIKHPKPKQTGKVNTDAQNLLEIINEQKAEREQKEQAKLNEQIKGNNSKSEMPAKPSQSIPSKFELDGKMYNIIKAVACKGGIICCLSKDDDGYTVIGNKDGKYKVLKHYDELKTVNIQSRVSEQNPDGSIKYLIRVSNHKFIVNVQENNMEFVVDLC